MYAPILPNREKIRILALESSCDETSAAVVENGRTVRSCVIASQIDIHKRYGGVVPEVASRNHTLAVNSVVDEALKKADMTFSDLDAVAVTYGAGLSGALLVGVSAAKAIAYACNLPLVKVNHVRGHIAANYITHPDLTPPFLCLVASGGHTALLLVEDYLTHRLLGSTTDDACGEAFDKVARCLGLGYPGGVRVDEYARRGKAIIPLVKPKHETHFDFSYSGLKTAVINYLHTAEQRGESVDPYDLCASFQSTAIDVLVDKTEACAKKFGMKKIAVAGGVSANSYLRARLDELTDKGYEVYKPELYLCGDNAAMIGAEGYYNLIAGSNLADLTLNAVPGIPL